MKVFNLFTLFMCTLVTLVASLPVEKRAINFGNIINSIIEHNKPQSYKTNDINYKNGRELDIYHGENIDANNLKPVDIFVFGGAFVFGSRSLNTGIGEYLMRRGDGHVSVVPDYVLFPAGQIDDMVEDIYQCILWVSENISKYGGDPENINIVAHSAGAHIASMVLLKTSLGLKNNGKVLAPFKENLIKSVVLLNGIYDFDEYVYKENIEELAGGSTLLESLVKVFMGTCVVSPTDILRKLSLDSDPDNDSFHLDVGKIAIVTTEEDTTVPPHSSEAFYTHLYKTTDNEVYYELLPGNHNTITGGMFDNSTETTELLNKYLY